MPAVVSPPRPRVSIADRAFAALPQLSSSRWRACGAAAKLFVSLNSGGDVALARLKRLDGIACTTLGYWVQRPLSDGKSDVRADPAEQALARTSALPPLPAAGDLQAASLAYAPSCEMRSRHQRRRYARHAADNVPVPEPRSCVAFTSAPTRAAEAETALVIIARLSNKPTPWAAGRLIVT